jgi:hypothetical protein
VYPSVQNICIITGHKYITLGGWLAYKKFNKFGEQIDKFSKPTSVNYDLLGVEVYGQILIHFFKKGFFFCFYFFAEYAPKLT